MSATPLPSRRPSRRAAANASAAWASLKEDTPKAADDFVDVPKQEEGKTAYAHPERKQKRPVKSEDFDAEGDDDKDFVPSATKIAKKSSGRGGGGGGRGAKKMIKGSVIGEAYGVLTNHQLEELPAPLLDCIIDLVIDTHELRPIQRVARDLLNLRVTCKTFCEAVARFLPTLEANLCEKSIKSNGKKLKIGEETYHVYTAELDELLRAPGRLEALPIEDLRNVYSFYGQSVHDLTSRWAVYDGRHANLPVEKMITDIRRNLPPRYFGLSYRARASLKASNSLWSEGMCKKDALKEYRLREKDLESIPYTSLPNPVNPFFQPMKFYPRWRLMEACLARHGSLQGLERYRIKCGEIAERAEKTRSENQGNKMKMMKQALSVYGMELSEVQIKHYFNEYICHSAGTPSSLAHRAHQIAVALTAVGRVAPGSLPLRSYLARAYIDSDASRKRNEARRAKKLAEKKKAGKATKTSTAAPTSVPASDRTPMELAAIITECEFFALHTDFSNRFDVETQWRHHHNRIFGSCIFDEYDYEAFEDYDDDDDDFPMLAQLMLPQQQGEGGDSDIIRDDKWEETASNDRFIRVRNAALRDYMRSKNITTVAEVRASTLPRGLQLLAEQLLEVAV